MNNLSVSEILLISTVSALLALLFYFTSIPILFFLFLVILYFIPSLVAFNREHPSKMAIFALNLLLGWTCIGWVVAFVWSLTGLPFQFPMQNSNAALIADELEKLAALKEKGILTEAEFQKKKKKLLSQ